MLNTTDIAIIRNLVQSGQLPTDLRAPLVLRTDGATLSVMDSRNKKFTFDLHTKEGHNAYA